MAKKPAASRTVETLRHDDARRKNIPTAEYQSVIQKEQESPRTVRYPRNTDLDPQLVWRGKDQQDWSDLVVHAPPLYIQEKVHPKALIDDLLRTTRERAHEAGAIAPDLFADFNGIPKNADKTEFYQHDQNWSNRMILGDSLQVMASLAEREGLRGKVQCIYFDPPYGIKFNSNFQWSTTGRDVKDGNAGHITREPEQVNAFRDTWRDGIHSYLTYLRDRLTVARDLLTDSGSIFVQIGDENVHRVRAMMDEVFGEDNFCRQIIFYKTTGKASQILDNTYDVLLWFAKNRDVAKYRPTYETRTPAEDSNLRFIALPDGLSRQLSPAEISGSQPLPKGGRVYRPNPITNQRPAQGADLRVFDFQGVSYMPGGGTFRTDYIGLTRAAAASRLLGIGRTLTFIRYLDDFPCKPRNDVWSDTRQSGFGDAKIYVVQTATRVIERCILMTTDPGDLVLDPTCGSGTTANVSEQWGRRWITVDTSRVALALARARVMGARYPFYMLADSRDGQIKEAEVTRTAPSSLPVRGDIRQGFVYERVPHITLKSIANNAEIDVIWEKWQQTLEPLREKLNAALGQQLREWEIPREADKAWPQGAKALHTEWWQARIARQKEIDASIAAKAEFEYLYDKPYEDRRKVRVAGPFTVESLSPHRVLGVDEDDELIDGMREPGTEYGAKQTFPQMILDNLKTAGVQQAHKADRITFTALSLWPGDGLVCAEGRYMEGEAEKRAAIFIGPEFGTVQRADLVKAAREAGDAGFDVLIACAFNYEAHTTEFNKLGRLPVLKARMNADLHMAEDLKNTGKGNLFVIFGEPDIDILPEKDGRVRVKVNGVDVFKPQTGEVVSDGADGIACWFIDTDYNEESFFVRHAYFLGANDPYGALKTTLKAEIDPEAWATLNSDTSRPFDRPKNGRIAVKVINHLGDEVMKVFRV
ncbi:site-specific DNA-methyltransferase [Vineibacter terrae]|uniref:site-specific DNA-methyltransferase (adenine-specific) n=1 Tax=Vineibacter terrae TaxID=2586908 RepID=A0A5C8PKK1_9HYPH|nr:site-specific DNA-methyltransferase [Vineibacter terrae]TXL74081.1 site-specific DNA-methyltransferase [Vineibacter terrae]